MTTEKTPSSTSVDWIVRRPVQYWYDPKRGKAWPFDGNYGGDDKLIKLTDAQEVLPIFDVLPRLWSDGYRTCEQDGNWHLFRKDGEGIATGKTFRDLCVNIVLAGL